MQERAKAEQSLNKLLESKDPDIAILKQKLEASEDLSLRENNLKNTKSSKANLKTQAAKALQT